MMKYVAGITVSGDHISIIGPEPDGSMGLALVSIAYLGGRKDLKLLDLAFVKRLVDLANKALALEQATDVTTDPTTSSIPQEDSWRNRSPLL